MLLAAIGRRAEIEPMWITTPDPRSIMPGTKARSSRAGPVKLRSMIACQSASDTDSNPPGLVSTPPALLTRMSSPLMSATSRLTTVSTPAAQFRCRPG